MVTEGSVVPPPPEDEEELPPHPTRESIAQPEINTKRANGRGIRTNTSLGFES